MLSQFAGAAVELDEALIVNPHETDAVAAALKRALEMPREERRERHAPMLAHLLKNDIKRWSRSYTSTLVARRNGRSLLGVMRHLLKPLPSKRQAPRLEASRHGKRSAGCPGRSPIASGLFDQLVDAPTYRSCLKTLLRYAPDEQNTRKTVDTTRWPKASAVREHSTEGQI